MSLVNDLLIEAERRRREARPARTLPLDDLVPAREDRSAHSGLTGLGIAAATCLVLGVIVALVGIAYRGPFPRTPYAPAPIPVASAPDALPTVAAPPSEAPQPPAAEPVPAHAASERPVRVESISLERTATSTRLRIVTDGRTAHRIEHDPASGRLDLVLAGAALVEPTEPLDLLDTPIRSLDLRAESSDVHLSLALDAEVYSQTRWLDLPDGAALILELQSSREPVANAVGEGEIGGSDPDGIERDVIEPDSSDAPPASIAMDPIVAPVRIDQIISPDLGDPESLHIERSQRDRQRASHAAERAEIADLLATAHRAHAEGRLDEADAGFAEIVLLAPDERAAVIEWSQVLVELGRGAEAISLVAGARASAPRDASLLIAHARLLEKTGDLAHALELLEESGLALTESPDVHALAAAYHQRAGDHEAAIERYKQILRRFPEESRGWMGLGISLEAVGRPSEARDVYRIALQVGELPTGTRRWVSARLSALGEEN